MGNNNIMEEVFSGSLWEAGVVKSLLENAQIDVYLYDSNLEAIIPWIAPPEGMDIVKIIVSSSNSEKARKIVNSYNEVCY